MELVENLSDLVRMEVLEDTEVVDAIERARLEREVEDARLLDPARARVVPGIEPRSEEHTSELQSHSDLVCRLLLEKKKHKNRYAGSDHRRGCQSRRRHRSTSRSSRP